MDDLDAALLDEMLNERLPNGQLPSIDALLQVLRVPEQSDPLLLKYLARRPSLKKFLEECMNPQNS